MLYILLWKTKNELPLLYEDLSSQGFIWEVCETHPSRTSFWGILQIPQKGFVFIRGFEDPRPPRSFISGHFDTGYATDQWLTNLHSSKLFRSP